MKVLQLVTVLACCGVCSDAFARRIYPWPYDKLTNQADLIVIATPVAVRDTDEETSIPDIRLNNTDPIPAIGMETSFEVLAVLKGNKNLKKAVLYHLREKNPPAANGPGLVSFDPQKKLRYLLFLKQEKDGRYSSVAGQTDPELAVKDLGTYP